MCAQDDWTVVCSTEKPQGRKHTHSTGGGKSWGHPVAVGLVVLWLLEKKNSFLPVPEKEQHLRFPRSRATFHCKGGVNVPYSQGGGTRAEIEDGIPDPSSLNTAFLNGVSCSSVTANWKGTSLNGFGIHLSTVHEWIKTNASLIEKK